MKKKAIKYAHLTCSTIMDNFPEADLPPKSSGFHYHAGVFLSGMMNTYKLCNDEKYSEAVQHGFDGILSRCVKIENDSIILSGTCVGTSVCDYEEYITRPTSENDLHGLGAFLLMCAELAI